jgi:hypothetical protein
MAQPNLTDRIRSITGYTANWNGNEDRYIYELIQKLEHSTFPTVFFIMVDECMHLSPIYTFLILTIVSSPGPLFGMDTYLLAFCHLRSRAL